MVTRYRSSSSVEAMGWYTGGFTSGCTHLRSGTEVCPICTQGVNLNIEFLFRRKGNDGSIPLGLVSKGGSPPGRRGL